MTTEEALLSVCHSPLISLGRLAELLNRTPGGLRVTLCRDGDLSEKLRGCRVQIGRRVMFRVADLAKMLDQA